MVDWAHYDVKERVNDPQLAWFHVPLMHADKLEHYYGLTSHTYTAETVSDRA